MLMMINALRDQLLEKTDSHFDDSIVFLLDDSNVCTSFATASRALQSMEWSKRVILQTSQAVLTPSRSFWQFAHADFMMLNLIRRFESSAYR